MKALSMALIIAALQVGQSASGPMAGSWTAKFEGRTFIRLEIETANGAIAGGISLGNFEVDGQGLVSRAEAAPANLTPIFGATLNGSTMTFFTKDGNATDRFELRLLEDVNADLHVLVNADDRRQLAAEGVPLPKPIRLTKGG